MSALNTVSGEYLIGLGAALLRYCEPSKQSFIRARQRMLMRRPLRTAAAAAAGHKPCRHRRRLPYTAIITYHTSRRSCLGVVGGPANLLN